MKQKNENYSPYRKLWRGCSLLTFAVLGLPIGFCIFMCSGVMFPLVGFDLINPVSRIEYAMQVDFHENTQILDVEYHRGIDDGDSFSISLIMSQYDFEGLVAEHCSSLDVIIPADSERDRALPSQYPQYLYTVNWGHRCNSDFAFVFLIVGVSEINNGMYTIDMWGETYCRSPHFYKSRISCTG